MFERKKALKEIEEKLNTVQMYLENNYKDLTLQSYKDAKEVVERYEKSGLLKQKDKDMIHRTAVKILSEVGARVLHEEARDLLAAAGAKVEDETVYIPEKLIDDALRTAPSSYAIYNADGSLAFTLEPNTVTFGTGTDMPE